MRTNLFASILFLAACSSHPAGPVPMGEPPISDTAPAQQVNSAAFLAAVKPLADLRSSVMPFATLTPRGAEVLRSGQTEISIQGHYGWQRTADDSFVVCVPNAETAQVSAVSSVGGIGFTFDVPGRLNTTILGTSAPLPRKVRPGDVLYVCSGMNAGISDRPVLGFAAQASSATVDEAVAVVFVGYDVEESRVGKLLRPPVWGRRGNPLVDFLRSTPIPEAAINWGKLPSVPISGAAEMLDFCWREHRYFSGDVFSEWSPHVRGVPITAHQQYGTFVLGQMGQAMLVACSNLPLESKKPLVLAIIQRAIDDLGGLCDDSWRYALGGHCWGRVGPLVMLGHMLNIDIFADPTPVVGKRLPEHQMVTVVPWWDTTPNARPWWTGYLYSTSNNGPTDPNLWKRHPSTWTGDRNVPGSGERWATMYGEQVIPAMTATATAIVLMGREQSAPALVNAVRCWVKGPPPAAVAELNAAGVNLHFGINYANGAVDAVSEWLRYGQ